MFKSLSLVIALSSVASLTAQAATVEYTAANASPESKLCVIAAQKGFSAARVEAQRHGIHISRFSKTLVCNGEDIRDIAKNAVKATQKEEQKNVALVAKIESTETELCIKAAQDGFSSAVLKGFKARNLRCNDMPVREFVKQYGKTAI